MFKPIYNGRFHKLILAAAGLSCALAAAGHASIIVSGNFDASGDVGFVNSPPNLSVTFGDGQGSIYQLDGFVNVAGQDYNNDGTGFGTSADLSYGSPPGVAYTFNATQPDADQLLLSYRFVNNTGSVLPGFQFLFFADPDIGPNFADESATVAGAPTPAGPGPGPQSYEIGDPSSRTIFTDLEFGTLNDVNSETPGNPGDVSEALGFTNGALGAGQSAEFQVLLSDDGSSMGSLALTQNDPVYPQDMLTLSGEGVSNVPEPTLSWTVVLLAIGAAIPFGSARRSACSQRLRPRRAPG